MTQRSWLAVLALVVVSGGAGGDTFPPHVIPLEWPLAGMEVVPEGTPFAGCVVLCVAEQTADPKTRFDLLCAKNGTPIVTSLMEGPRDGRGFALERTVEGALRIFFGGPGEIGKVDLLSLGEQPHSLSVLRDEKIAPEYLGDRPDLDGDGTNDLVQVLFDSVGVWRGSAEGFVPFGRIKLPFQAWVRSPALGIRSDPLMIPIPPAPERWTWPVPQAGGRLRSFRVPLGTGSPGEAFAAWVSHQAQVVSAIVAAGDPPRLVAITEPNDKVALLGERSLIVAPLSCKAGGKGTSPNLVAKTDFPNYGPAVKLDLRDADGDARLDIIAVGITGRLHPDIEVAVWRSEEGGSFANKSRTWSKKLAQFPRSFTGLDRDVTGDGRPDLVVIDAKTVWLARGIERNKGQVPLEKEPSLRWTIPEETEIRGEGKTILDLGGGQRALVFAGRKNTPDKKTNPVLVLLPFRAD